MSEIKIFNRVIKFSLHQERAVLLICIFIALLFWFFMKMSNVYTTEKTFNLEYKLADKLAFTETPQKEVSVILTGRGWALLNTTVFSGRPSLKINIQEAGNINLSRSRLLSEVNRWAGSSNLEKTDITIDVLPLQVETLSFKTIPVEFTGTIDCAKGFQASIPPYLMPDSIEITGAKSQIESITSWQTESIVFENVTQSISEPIALKASPNSELRLSAIQVELNAPIEVIMEQSMFIPITIINNVDSVTLSNKNIQVRYAIGAGIADEYDSEDFEAVVDFSQVSGDKTDNTLLISLTKLPEHIKVINFTPKSVSFLIIKEELEKPN